MFLENKYTKCYLQIVERAKLENRKKLKRSDKYYVYYEYHHIIPRSLGGKEVVLLTTKEHYICHLLLPKMLTGTPKHWMINALIKMTFSKSKGQERYTSKSYAVVKSFIAEKNSEMFKGKKMSEERRKKMSEKRKGIIFTEEHKNNIRISVIKRNLVGKNNPFYGRKHSEETKINWSKKRKGIIPPFSSKGCKWYNNGIKETLCHEDEVPDGFFLGRIKWKDKNK